MTWSYKKRIKIIPGVHLNISKSGISTTIKVMGVNVNMSTGGTTIPAFGIYNRRKVALYKSQPEPANADNVIIEYPSYGNIFSVAPGEITSNDMSGIKDTIIAAHKQKSDLKQDLRKIKSALVFSRFKLVFSILIPPVAKKIKSDIISQKDAILNIEEEIDNTYVKLDIEFGDGLKSRFEGISDMFKQLSKSEKIWDVTNEEMQNRKTTRSSASTVVMKKEVTIGLKEIPDIKSDFVPLWFKNANGADLYVYPGFVIMYNSIDQFGIIGLDELDFHYKSVRFVETGIVPKDSKVIDNTWAKVNKNGAPDKRFRDNFQIPVVRYGGMTFKSKNGLNEEYEFSNYEATESFGYAFANYISMMKAL